MENEQAVPSSDLSSDLNPVSDVIQEAHEIIQETIEDVQEVTEITKSILINPDIIPCIYCEADNKLEVPSIHSCYLCHNPFCTSHQSRQDTLACSMCIHDIQVTDTQEHKTITRFSARLNHNVTRTQHCRVIRFDGGTWRSCLRLIESLTDKELFDALEIQRASINQMEQELLTRNIKKARKQAEDDASASHKRRLEREAAIANGIAPDQDSVKKIRIKTSKSSQEQLAASVKKAGITPEMLRKMIARMEIK